MATIHSWIIVLLLALASQEVVCNSKEFDVKEDAVVTEAAYLDIAIGNEDPKRVEIGLFGAMTPKTVRNFVALANHEVRRFKTQ